jgi:WD40 repeat protein
MRITCECGRSLHVRDELIGKRVKCPACGEILAVVQEQAANAGAPRPAAQPAPRPKTAPAAPVEPRRPAAEDETPVTATQKRGTEAYDDEEEKRPQLSAKRPPARSSRLLWIGLGGGALALAAAVVLIVVLWRSKGGPEVRPPSVADEKLVDALIYAPDGVRLVTTGQDPVAPGAPPVVKVWDLGSGKEVARLHGLGDAAERLAFSPDGKLFAASAGGEILVWEVGEQELIATIHPPYDGPWLPGSRLLALDPSGTRLVTIAPGPGVMVLDARTTQLDPLRARFASFPVSPDERTAGACMPGRTQAAYGRWDRETRQSHLEMLDYSTGRSRRILLSDAASAMAFSADGGTLAVAQWDGPVKVIDTRDWSVRATLDRPKQGGFKYYSKVDVSPDGGVICAIPTAGASLATDLWTLRATATVRPLLPGPCNDLAFAPDGKTLAVAVGGQGVRFIDPSTGQEKPSDVSGPARNAPAGAAEAGPAAVASQQAAARTAAEAAAYLRTRKPTWTLTEDKTRPGHPVVSARCFACTPTNEDWQALRDLKSLEGVSLYECPLPTGSLLPLRGIAKLRKLSIKVGREGAPALAEVGSLQSLRVLHVVACKDPDALMEAVAHLVNLEELSVTDAPDLRYFTGLHLLKDLPHLHSLTIDSEYAAAGAFRELRHLRSVDFRCPADADMDLTPLQALPDLRSLRLTKRLSDADLAALAGVSSLRELRLPVLAATDAGLAQLHRLKHLQVLTLDASGFTARGLGELRGLHELRELHVSGVTDAGIDALRKALPHTTIDRTSRPDLSGGASRRRLRGRLPTPGCPGLVRCLTLAATRAPGGQPNEPRDKLGGFGGRARARV